MVRTTGFTDGHRKGRLTQAYRVWAVGDGIRVAQVDGRLVQTDPVAGGITADVATGLSPIDLAAGGESVWALIGVQGTCRLVSAGAVLAW